MMSQVYLPRLIIRDYPYDQSSNRVRIYNKNVKQLFTLFARDWFHVLLRVPWFISFPIIILIWYLMIWVFAYFYLFINNNKDNLAKDCGLGQSGVVITLGTAYAFSLETCTTVGCE